MDSLGLGFGGIGIFLLVIAIWRYRRGKRFEAIGAVVFASVMFILAIGYYA